MTHVGTFNGVQVFDRPQDLLKDNAINPIFLPVAIYPRNATYVNVFQYHSTRQEILERIHNNYFEQLAQLCSLPVIEKIRKDYGNEIALSVLSVDEVVNGTYVMAGEGIARTRGILETLPDKFPYPVETVSTIPYILIAIQPKTQG